MVAVNGLYVELADMTRGCKFSVNRNAQSISRTCAQNQSFGLSRLLSIDRVKLSPFDAGVTLLLCVGALLSAGARCNLAAATVLNCSGLALYGAAAGTMRVELIGHLKPCMAEIYLHI